MRRVLRYLGQGGAYLLVALVLGYFSDSPAYTHFPPDKAQIKLGFVHGAARKGGCRRFTAEEIAALPPNMRRPMDCPRERVPVVIELILDGAVLYREELPPMGLAKDGPARVYERFTVAPGRRHLVARLRDSERGEGFDYEREAAIDLAAGESLAIDSRAELGGFLLP